MSVESTSRAAEVNKEQQVRKEKRINTEASAREEDAVVMEMKESAPPEQLLEEAEPQQERRSETKVDQMA
ncbi:MAG: hypothetical protein IT292_10920 [Deltaproteobacteria bacterium]|nr:hypothetical protein [Deltaproteobacteria bacterium]